MKRNDSNSAMQRKCLFFSFLFFNFNSQVSRLWIVFHVEKLLTHWICTLIFDLVVYVVRSTRVLVCGEILKIVCNRRVCMPWQLLRMLVIGKTFYRLVVVGKPLTPTRTCDALFVLFTHPFSFFRLHTRSLVYIWILFLNSLYFHRLDSRVFIFMPLAVRDRFLSALINESIFRFAVLFSL